MTTTAQLRLIGYRRVSTAGQVDRYGLPAQEADLRRYARVGKHQLVRIETDAAPTGTLPAHERPGLLAAIRTIEDKKADGLLVPDLFRLARELEVQEAALAMIWRAGGHVFTIDPGGEVLADDPDEPLRTALRKIQAVIGELDRALVGKRMRNGRKAKAAQGGYAGYGSPAFGQRSVDTELVTDQAEAAVIARMRELRGEGLSYRVIAARLNEEGLKSKRGVSWHPETVSRVLSR